MICAVAIFLLVSTIGCANAEADSRKLAIPKTLEKLERSQEPIYPYLTQGCKAWEGNCERKWNQEGECEKQEVICKENFYRCSEDDPEAPCCVAEENRPLACPQNSTEPTPTPSEQNATSNATELDTTASQLNSTWIPVETESTLSPENTTSNGTEPDYNTTLSWTLTSTQSDNTTENATEAQTTQGPTINPLPAGQCPPNEHYEACPKCGEVQCRDLELRSGGGNDGNDTCSQGTNCRGKPRCLCNPDFSRNDAGSCVPDAFCTNSRCGSNTHYEDCPVCNDVKCDEIVSRPIHLPPSGPGEPPAFPPVPTSPLYCLAKGCRCNVGYARDANDNCAQVIGGAPDACDFASG
ncbi:hypothetical protein Ddc_13932 [Ditylenchus destructor]|nr:hypothetical protein Ddc_13932 [Ditylenchus destructor]